jgi:hypothetical protein
MTTSQEFKLSFFMNHMGIVVWEWREVKKEPKQ